MFGLLKALNKLKPRGYGESNMIALSKLFLLLNHKTVHRLVNTKEDPVCMAISVKKSLLSSNQNRGTFELISTCRYSPSNLHFQNTGAEQNWVSKVSSNRFVKCRHEQKSHNTIDNFVKQAVGEAERPWLQPPTNKVNYTFHVAHQRLFGEFSNLIHACLAKWQNSSRWRFNYACGKWIGFISVLWFNQAADLAPISSRRESNHFLLRCGWWERGSVAHEYLRPRTAQKRPFLSSWQHQLHLKNNHYFFTPDEVQQLRVV